MKKQNDKLIEIHSMGSNCNTNAIKTIMQYYGYNVDEDMVLGLGSGLGFIYQYYSGSNSFFLSGKNESLELNISTAFGGTTISHSFDDMNYAWNKAKYYVDNDIPIIMDLSITHLPYFAPYLKEIKNVGFGLHNAILVGYDEEEKTVLLLDHRWSSPQKISMEVLCKSRSAINIEFNSRGAFRAMLLPPPSTHNIENEILYAMRLNVNRLMYPFAFKMGLPGLKTFKKEISNMVSSPLTEENRNAIETFAILMEKLGTGGGNFRRMYSRFIKKIANISRFSDLERTGKIYAECAILWKNLSLAMIQWSISTNQTEAAKIHLLLDKIIENEYLAVENINDFLNHL